MKNLSNSLSDIFAEKSVNFYGKMNFSFAKLPSFVISLRFGAFSWDQLPLKKPWICLIFEMLKSLHENWNCTAMLLQTNLKGAEITLSDDYGAWNKAFFFFLLKRIAVHKLLSFSSHFSYRTRILSKFLQKATFYSTSTVSRPHSLCILKEVIKDRIRKSRRKYPILLDK